MAEFHYSDVLIAPIISEKSNEMMMNQGKYLFLVSPSATKTSIGRAVSERFGVQVAAVNIVNLPRKPKRAGRHVYHTAKRRKAIITLAAGEHIPELSEAL